MEMKHGEMANGQGDHIQRYGAVFFPSSSHQRITGEYSLMKKPDMGSSSFPAASCPA
jgi:hypothetical protein